MEEEGKKKDEEKETEKIRKDGRWKRKYFLSVLIEKGKFYHPVFQLKVLD